jgi:predicted dehydrogenase
MPGPEGNTIRVGVVGLRRGESLVRTCNAVGGARVEAIYDPDAVKLTHNAASHDARAFDDIDAFLASDLDLVVVASPVPFHATQSIAALEAGKHVLSEVVPFRTIAEAEAVHAAMRRSGRQYFVGENCVFHDEIEALHRLRASNRFGRISFGEGDYVHDCTGLWTDDAGKLTWRGRGDLGIYATHGLGPLLYIMDDRVTEVRCTVVPGGIVAEAPPSLPTAHLLEMRTARGAVLRTRVDAVSHRPHLTTTRFVLQGATGAYESALDGAHGGHIWLADAHEPVDVRTSGRWHPLDELYDELIPDRLTGEAIEGGHGASEFWLFRSVLAAIRDDIPCPIAGDAAFDIGLPCAAALASAEGEGTWIPVPDSRTWHAP